MQAGGCLSRPDLAVEAPRPTSMHVVHAEASKEPKWQEVLLLVCVCYALYLGLVTLRDNYASTVRVFGDNIPYVQISAAIRHWDFSGLRPKLFWGLPYAMAALTKATGISDLHSLLALSIISSLAVIFLVYRLWGGWVAGFFAVASREWMERSLLGGAEPLFLACIFGAFVAARKERWWLAALLAALGTIVRPMGIFALAGIGISLLLRKDFRNLVVATVIGAVVGFLYILPLKLYVGSSLANVKGYDQADWNGGVPLGVPLVAIVQDAIAGRATKLNLTRTAIWIIAVGASVVVILCSKTLRDGLRKYPVEGLFFVLYVFLLFTYNSYWARAEFPRFAIPVIPFVVLAFLPWIPRSRALLWAFGIFSAVLSAIETTGFVETIRAIRHAF
jgi:hypothetical protein